MKTLTGLFLSIFLSSCSHYYYVANEQNVPLFTEKNEYRISGSCSVGDVSGSFEVQSAYSVSDNIGILADFMHTTGGDVSGKNWAKGNYADGAIGYFKPFDYGGVFEIYGGIGFSNQNHQYESLTYKNGTYTDIYGGYAELSYVKLFVQPSFGFTAEWFDIAISSRIGDLFFTNISKDLYGPGEELDQIRVLGASQHLLFEPALTLRVGWKFVKLQLQASAVLKNQDLRFEPYHIGLGLFVSFPGKKKEKK